MILGRVNDLYSWEMISYNCHIGIVWTASIPCIDSISTEREREREVQENNTKYKPIGDINTHCNWIGTPYLDQCTEKIVRS